MDHYGTIVLNNMTKFHKILIKTIRLRQQTLLGVMYERTDRRTGVTLNAAGICPGHRHGRGIISQHGQMRLLS